MNRVVITGLGVISPIGNTPTEFFDNLLKGKHGFAPITAFETDDIPVKIAAEVKDFDPTAYIEKKEARRMDRYCQFAVAAAKLAVENCKTDFKDLDPFRIGVIFGSGVGGFNTFSEEYGKFLEKGPRRVSALFIPMMIANMAAGTIAIHHGFKGDNFAPVTACATSTNAIGEAFRKIKHGYLDAVITGGAEAAITKFALAGFDNMMALSTGIDPDRVSIPFDKERSGFVMGEGAGCLVLESLDHALERGADIIAEIVGYGATGDAYHITSPDPDGLGAAKAMELAFTEGGLKAEDVDYINAHGTSTSLNDKYETKAIKLAFGEYSKKVAISSTKSVTGHMLGAAGAIEAIACSMALKNGIIPPTIGYKVPDEECDLDYVTEGCRKQAIKTAVSNTFGFGGHNASVCFKKYE